MPTYSVRIPIAGHVIVDIEAGDEAEAIRKALDYPVTNDDIETWETLEMFQQGNVSYCPSPWKVEAILIDDGDAE